MVLVGDELHIPALVAVAVNHGRGLRVWNLRNKRPLSEGLTYDLVTLGVVDESRHVGDFVGTSVSESR